MRTFAAAVPDTGQRGFTLVELMVVLAVLALAATVVLITAPTSDSQLRSEGDRLASRVAALRDMAIVEGRPMAIMISPSGYGFERRMRDGWEPLAGRGFGQHDWPTAVRLQGQGSGALQRIIFDPIGMTAQRTRVTITDGEGVTGVTVSASGEVSRGE